MRFSKKLLENPELFENYKRILLQVFVAGVHSIVRREVALEVGATHTNWGPILNSALLHRDKKLCEEEFAHYTSTKTLLVDNRQKP